MWPEFFEGESFPHRPTTANTPNKGAKIDDNSPALDVFGEFERVKA